MSFIQIGLSAVGILKVLSRYADDDCHSYNHESHRHDYSYNHESDGYDHRHNHESDYCLVS